MTDTTMVINTSGQGQVSFIPSFDGMGVTRMETIMPKLDELESGQEVKPEVRYIEISVNCTTCGKVHNIEKPASQHAATPAGWAMVHVRRLQFVKRIFICNDCAKIIVHGSKKRT